jgi:hypothetical protein
MCRVGGSRDICIQEQDWQPLDFEALVLHARVTMSNLTERQQKVSAFRIESEQSLVLTDIALIRRAELLSESRPLPSGIIPAHQRVSGWVASAFKHQPRGGTPAYDLITEDGVRNRYRIHVPQREPQEFE